MERHVVPTRDLLRQLVPPRPEEIGNVRAAVRAAAIGRLSEDRIDDLLVAVSEACTNAIEAQLMAGAPLTIELRCLEDGTSLVVEVEDRAGPGFDPRRLPPRASIQSSTGLSAERGWGVVLMRRLLDDVSFVPTPEGTIVRLVMHLDAHA